MKSVKIEGKKRSELGKKATRQLRSEGNVPGVIYGGNETIHFSAPLMAFRSLVYTPEFQLAEISISGNVKRAIVKDLQFDVITDELSHVDLFELVEDRKVIANLPIKFTGQPVGVKDGGRLELKMKSLRIRTYPKYLVEHIEVNLDNLELHGNVRVEDVKTDNMEKLNSPRVPVASVVTTRALRVEETPGVPGAAAAAATPAAGAAAPAAAVAAPAAEKKKEAKKK